MIRFAAELAVLLPADLQKVLLVTTGSESNEAAIRMAKMYTGGHEVLGLSASWHGMTAAASASTYSAGRSGYGPIAPGNMPLPTPNPYRCPVRHCTTTCDMTCLDVGMGLCDAQSVGRPAAVIVEPILSAGGIDLGLNLNIVKFPGMGAVLRIAPPMTVTDDEIDRALEIMDTALRTAEASTN